MSVASELFYRQKVHGLRDFEIYGPVKVMDAGTLRVKRIIKKPPTFEDLLLKVLLRKGV